tara:strand:- start:127 stop:312 length:186 start_codon:yes stop_codon:yes gene_type:complete
LIRKYCIYLTTVIVLLPFTFTDLVVAKEITPYIKGLGSPLREQPMLDKSKPVVFKNFPKIL